jgi:LCP family protein required for cell wall assembly
MIIHVDRARDFVSMLSVPRDLYVDIPGFGKGRVNAAYYRGGPALTIGTLKQTLGLDITKYMGVGFEAFPGIIDSLGGVYVDVDRKYTDTPHWEMDLAPGYQLLDGANTLLYSRYRFDDSSDVGRMARQQRILQGIRDQALGWDLTFSLPGIVGDLLDSATTNLSSGELVELARWIIELDGSRIKQTIIKGPGRMIDGNAVIVVDQPTLAATVADVLTPPEEDPSQASEDGPGGPILAATGSEALRLALAAPGPTGSQFGSTPAALPDAGMWRSAQKSVPFPLQAPAFIPEGFAYAYRAPEEGGTYGIRAGDETKPCIRMAYRYRDTDLYLGVSATTWTDAPLARDGRRIESNGVIYTLVGTSGSVDHIWWEKDGVLYFISNTLMGTVTWQDLLNMAESMTPVS